SMYSKSSASSVCPLSWSCPMIKSLSCARIPSLLFSAIVSPFPWLPAAQKPSHKVSHFSPEKLISIILMSSRQPHPGKTYLLHLFPHPSVIRQSKIFLKFFQLRLGNPVLPNRHVDHIAGIQKGYGPSPAPAQINNHALISAFPGDPA